MDVTPKPDDKKKAPPEIVREDVEFFEELPIPINIEGEGKSFVVFMRLLKVKEIPILNRIVYMQERDPNSEQAAVMLISLAASTLNVPSDEIPVEASSGLVKNMISFNFPKKEEALNDKSEEKPTKKPRKKDGLVNCIDFLIANGHTYSDIMEYPVKIFDTFIMTVADRLRIKPKTTDPAEAFRKLGLPVKPRGSKK